MENVSGTKRSAFAYVNSLFDYIKVSGEIFTLRNIMDYKDYQAGATKIFGAKPRFSLFLFCLIK